MRCFIVCCLLSSYAYGLNEARVAASCQVIVYPDAGGIKFEVNVFPTLNIVVDENASIAVTQTTVKKTYREIASAGKVTVPIMLTAIPNVSSGLGYTVTVDMLAMRMNLDLFSDNFQQLQMVVLEGTPASLLNGKLLYKDEPAKPWALLPSGIRFAPTWETTNALVSATSVKKTITFSLEFTKEDIFSQGVGTYWFQLLLAMNPTSASQITAAQASHSVVVAGQIDTIDYFIAQADVYLADEDLLFRLTDDQVAVLTRNKVLLEKQRKELLAVL